MSFKVYRWLTRFGPALAPKSTVEMPENRVFWPESREIIKITLAAAARNHRASARARGRHAVRTLTDYDCFKNYSDYITVIFFFLNARLGCLMLW